MKSLIAMLIATTFVLAGCNTIAGAGKDIESGGEHVHDAAKDVQRQM